MTFELSEKGARIPGLYHCKLWHFGMRTALPSSPAAGPTLAQGYLAVCTNDCDEGE